MNILIIEANGRVGTQLAQILPSKGILCTLPPAAQARIGRTKISAIKRPTSTAPLADISQIVAAIRPDAVYFTAGSRGKNLLQVDAFGAVSHAGRQSQRRAALYPAQLGVCLAARALG